VIGITLALLLVSVFCAGLPFLTHLTCYGGRDGSCSLDTYGLFTRDRHVEFPVRDIVEVSVDERASTSRGTRVFSATVMIVTRSRGRVDLGGRQLLGSAIPTDKAVAVAVALRRLQAKENSSPKDVDLWVGSSWLGIVIELSISLGFFYLFAMLVKTIVRELRQS
jgi:hypothetical protein